MKESRQGKIVELVENFEIETQDELVEKLRTAGFQATQATVSRDIRQLKLSKISAGNGKQKYIILPREEAHMGDKYGRVLREGFISMDKAQNILVIKTVSGMAMAVAAALDALRLPEVVGSIAGDDTIMAAIRTAEETDLVMKRIQKLLAR